MNIYESIAAIQADIDFIGKNRQTETGQKFKYRGVDQVLNTLHPLFAKYKVFAVPEVLEVLNREWKTTQKGGIVVYQTVKVKYTFYAEDGSNVSAVVIGEAMDSGDKASNKCMSVAYKYACFQILSIPTEETTADPDENAEGFQASGDPAGARKEVVPPINGKTLYDFGCRDVEATMAWIEKKAGKPIPLLDDEERKAVWALLETKKRKGNEGQAQQGV